MADDYNHSDRREEKPPPFPPSGWADESTQGLSEGSEAVSDDSENDLPRDSFFIPRSGNTEPETLFDESAPRQPRELKIASEHDGKQLSEGHIINERFEIRGCLGQGNVGTVYLVDDLRLKDKKALKLMHPALVDSTEAALRFITEIKMLQRLSHEHVIRVYDYGKAEGSELSFFTMEYIEGVTLAGLLKKRGGKIPLEKAVGIVRQILDTLAYAHQHTNHRNLKPVNIMVRPNGKIVLLNFGISTTTSSTGLQVPQVRLGSSHYQAPEQRENPEIPDPRVDLYAAGAILYQMLTGNIPIDPITRPRRINSAIPRALDRVIMRSLAPQAVPRFPDAKSMRASIDRALRPVSTGKKALAGLFVLLLFGAAVYIGSVFF